jgi:mannose-6-phosphate isomerase-like protein (cupin superfamily)
VAAALQSAVERTAKVRQRLRLGRVAEPTVIPPGGGEIVGHSPDRRVEILSDDPALHVTWSRFGPGRDGADLHVHRLHTDVFCVLAGELTVRLGIEGEEVAVPAGRLVVVPPMVVHGFRNASDAELRYLNLHAPGTGFADYMRGIRDGRRVPFDQEPPPADGIRPATDALVTEPPVDTGALAIALLTGEARVDGALYVLDGPDAGSWVQLPPGAPRAVVAPGRCLHIRPGPARPS